MLFFYSHDGFKKGKTLIIYLTISVFVESR